MTTRWKLKTDSSKLFLVFVTHILLKTEWVRGQNLDVANSIDDNDHQTHVYIGNDNIAHFFFGSSSNNTLEDVQKCLDSFQLVTCMKMLLLSRIDDVVGLMEEANADERDLHMLNGILTFKVKNSTVESVPDESEDDLSLDEEIAVKVRRIFWKRSLLVNLLPNTKIEIEPQNSKDDFFCFRYWIRQDTDYSAGDEVEARKRKGGMPMMMLVPQLIMLGLMPFTLASLKAMVMNAVMINMMALNGAIFMTIRNLVFGPREGDNVQYVNYGYSKDRQTQRRRPVLIIHSPAAFVKQPPVHRKPSASQVHHSYSPEGHFSSSSQSHYNQDTNNILDSENYYIVHQNNGFQSEHESEHSWNRQAIQNRNEEKPKDGFYSTIAKKQPNTQTANYVINPNQRNFNPKVKYYKKPTTTFAQAQAENRNSQRIQIKPNVRQHFEPPRRKSVATLKS